MSSNELEVKESVSEGTGGDETSEQPTTELPAYSSISDVRVAVVGNVDAGKSTLVGVLTSGKLDNGRGSARRHVFTHKHEDSTGRTSAVSQHIMGFSDEKTLATNEVDEELETAKKGPTFAGYSPVYQTTPANASSLQKSKGWRHVLDNSRSVVTFVDLAGHERYLKTTIGGLTGSHPDYAMIMVNALAGITRMTKEHLGCVLALRIPLFVIITKVDMCPANVMQETKVQLWKALRSVAAGCRVPILVQNHSDVNWALCDRFHVGDSDVKKGDGESKDTNTTPSEENERKGSDDKGSKKDTTGESKDVGDSGLSEKAFEASTSHLPRSGFMSPSCKITPVFTVSSVSGQNLDLLTSFISRLLPRRVYSRESTGPIQFDVDETFQVSGVGVVVSGSLTSGVIQENTKLLLGPFTTSKAKTGKPNSVIRQQQLQARRLVEESGSLDELELVDEKSAYWLKVVVRSIHLKRCPVPVAFPGQACSLAIRPVRRKKDELKRSMIRKGMALVTPGENDEPPQTCTFFEADILLLHHPSTIRPGYQAMVHVGSVRQAAALCKVLGKVQRRKKQKKKKKKKNKKKEADSDDNTVEGGQGQEKEGGQGQEKEGGQGQEKTTDETPEKVPQCLRTGDRVRVLFQFLYRPVFLHKGMTFIFREGCTKGIGRIVRIVR